MGVSIPARKWVASDLLEETNSITPPEGTWVDSFVSSTYLDINGLGNDNEGLVNTSMIIYKMLNMFFIVIFFSL